MNDLEFGFDQWVIRYGEGQPRNDRVRERFAENIDTAPETVGTEKDALARRCSVSARLMLRFYWLPATRKFWFARRP
jgi:hypothetical protein